MPSQRSAHEQAAIRHDVFRWLDELLAAGRWELTRTELENYAFDGERIPLLDRNRGIRNPVDFASTLTVMTSAKKDHPYDDQVLEGGVIKYSYRAQQGGDNKKLVKAYELQEPIVYLRGVRAGVYVPYYPVYIIRNLPAERAVLLSTDEIVRALGNPDTATPAMKRYAESMARTRLHQPMFRAQVMHAYEGACAVCSLKHADLLDAAHIIGDNEDDGRPVVTNGLSLCKIHHSSYDRNLLGITPDYEIRIDHKVLEEVDGPMLKYGIQAMHGRQLKVPRRKAERPDVVGLTRRFEDFTLGQDHQTRNTVGTNTIWPPSGSPDLYPANLTIPRPEHTADVSGTTHTSHE